MIQDLLIGVLALAGLFAAGIGIGTWLYRRNLSDDALLAEDEEEEQHHIGGL